MKRCQFCLRERPAHSFYRVAKGKNYKHVYTCWKCRPYFLKGCKLDKVKRIWRTYKPTKVTKSRAKPKEFKITKGLQRTFLKGMVKVGRPSKEYPVEFKRQEAVEKLILENYLD